MRKKMGKEESGDGDKTFRRKTRKSTPKINLDFGSKAHSSTTAEKKKSLKNIEAVLIICENLARQKSKSGYKTTEEFCIVLINHSIPF